MFDPLALGALALGAVCLVLWYTSEQSQRGRERTRTLRRVTEMTDKHRRGDATSNRTAPAPIEGRGLPVQLIAGLPPELDTRDVSPVVENLLLFRESKDTIERFVIYLRDRYHSRWEIKILENIKNKFDAESAAIEAAGKRHSVRDRTATEIATATLDRQRKERELEDFKHTAPHDRERSTTEAQARALEEKNRLLKAQLQHDKLKRQAAGDTSGRGEEQDAYERGRRTTRTARAEQKGALDEELELQERMRREFEAKKVDIENDNTRTSEEKAAAIKQLRTQYAKILAREY